MQKIPDPILPSAIENIPTKTKIPAKIKINIPIPAEICVEKNNKAIIMITPIIAIMISPFVKFLCITDDFICLSALEPPSFLMLYKSPRDLYSNFHVLIISNKTPVFFCI